MTETAKLKDSDPVAYASFGKAVGISGNYAVLGAGGDITDSIAVRRMFSNS